MYNNKQYKLAQSSFQEGIDNLKEYFGEVGKNTKTLIDSFTNKPNQPDKDALKEDIKNEMEKGNFQEATKKIQELGAEGVELLKDLALYFAGDVAALAFLKSMGVEVAAGAGGLAAGAGGFAGMFGAKAIMAVVEQIKGDLAVYKDYMTDFYSDMNAILRLFPNDERIKYLIAELKDQAIEGYQTIEKAKEEKEKEKEKITNAFTKTTKVAIVGEANWGSYGHQFAEGAGFGFGAGGGLYGSLAGGLGFSLADAAKDIYHNFQSPEYQAAAYSHEMVEKVGSMVLNLQKYNPNDALSLQELTIEFDKFIRKEIYKEQSINYDPAMEMIIEGRKYLEQNKQQEGNLINE